MIFGEMLSSITIVKISLISIEGVGGKAEQKNASIGIRNICELLQSQFQNNLSKLTVEQETKIESELEYLFIKLKELEDVANERR